MVNSMHRDLSEPFELIIVDNCHGDGPHRAAINEIFDTYETVTHVVRNRQNEFHGGGIKQGVALADGDIICQTVDDIEYRYDWLSSLVRPLRIYPNAKYIAAPILGHNTSSKLVRMIPAGEFTYKVYTNAAAYCWMARRKDWESIGKWRRSHFADTRWATKARAAGFRFVVPTWKVANETNLNYLRPWNYSKEKRNNAKRVKINRIEQVFKDQSLTLKNPYRPVKEWPRKNPKGYGPGKYPDDWLRKQGVEI